MIDGAPDAIDLGVDALEAAQPIEIRRRNALGRGERTALRGQQLADGRVDVLRLDRRKLR